MNIHCKYCSQQVSNLDEACCPGCGKTEFIYDQEMAEIEAFEEEMDLNNRRYFLGLHPDDIKTQLKTATWRTAQDDQTVINQQTGRTISKANEISLIDEIKAATDSLLISLSKTETDLRLDNLENLSDTVAEALGKNKWSVLSLNGLKSLTPSTAQALANRHGPTHLDGLKTLETPIASILATFQAITLSLDGLNTLDSSTAEILARYPKRLSLNGLTEIDEATAEALSANKGQLSLEGLRTPSPRVIGSLAQHRGRGLTIGRKSRTHESISVIVDNRTPGFEHVTDIKGLNTLAPTVIDLLALPQGQKGEITIRGLLELTKEQAQALTAHEWDITFDCLHTISEETAGILSQHRGTALKLKRLTHLDAPQAKAIAGYQGHLGLNNLAFIDDSVASELGKHRGTGLNLNSLCNLSTTQARALATHSGVIHLCSITTLSVEAAAELSNHTSELYLDEITELSDAAAMAIAKHKGQRLSLRNLTKISPTARKALLTHLCVGIPNH